MLAALFEDNTNSSFECTFITSVNIKVVYKLF